MPAGRFHLLPLQLVFALNALGLSAWFPRIPDVKEALGLDVLTLAFCLFGMPVGTMLGFLTVGRIIRAIGLRATCVCGGSAFLISFIGPALAPNALTLGLALFLCGLTIATIEVSMNAKASQTERVLGRRIMTRCHAFWSFGTVLGAMLGGSFAERGVSFLHQQLVLQPIFAAATVFFALRLIPDDPEEEQAIEKKGFSLPSAALVLMCIVPLGALLIEGAMMEWSALLMREWKGGAVRHRGHLLGLRAGNGGGAADRRPAGRAVRAAVSDPVVGADDGARHFRLRAGAGALAVAAGGGAGRRRAAATSIP